MQLMNNLLLDTHILIWSLTKSDELTVEVKEAIKLAKADKSLYLSSISLWEIAMLAQKQRISVYRRIADFLQTIEKIRGLNILQITANIAAESVTLPGDIHGDPADRIIIASCREISATLITRDQQILDWANLGHMKTLRG
ncbi:MAG: type II toxin-antitoxin system VapC family toxin [Alphaproteobacteria bacterium]|nr:type II toxin-antitoxin system VapC family toxin [Alphaproteobacteria bacterium]